MKIKNKILIENGEAADYGLAQNRANAKNAKGRMNAGRSVQKGGCESCADKIDESDGQIACGASVTR